MTTPGGIPMAVAATVPRFREGLLRLADGRALALFDWRGSGQSERRLPRCLDDLLEDVVAVTDALGAAPDVSVANTGCLVACTFAARNPKAWRSLVLSDPMVRSAGSPQATITRPGWEGDHPGFVQTLVRNFFPWLHGGELEWVAREWAETVPSEAHQVYRSLDAELDLTETLPSLDVPVLVYKVFSRSMAPAVAALIPGSVLIERPFGVIGRRVRQDWDQFIGARFGETPSTPEEGTSSLTPRERDVLTRLARGKSSASIAAELTLSPRTVDRHVANIYAKLHVHNRAEATRWALEHGVD
jgi:DNA-binding CsgD family transcriptional regulator